MDGSKNNASDLAESDAATNGSNTDGLIGSLGNLRETVQQLDFWARSLKALRRRAAFSIVPKVQRPLRTAPHRTIGNNVGAWLIQIEATSGPDGHPSALYAAAYEKHRDAMFAVRRLQASSDGMDRSEYSTGRCDVVGELSAEATSAMNLKLGELRRL
ncbi:hypothetical protein [Aureimonas leprariae]|uniref:Uncharacterized protein n=1 Tax=Plantimonas leprariae TaxID=2615207 RepID=A0A7V7PQ85_9HYPH|nr:hypothetical protein [Aureimonas leprariae]KAB0680187.1 hypothetical protein F6X38_08330 [Aureimonas leprariae]